MKGPKVRSTYVTSAAETRPGPWEASGVAVDPWGVAGASKSAAGAARSRNRSRYIVLARFSKTKRLAASGGIWGDARVQGECRAWLIQLL